MRIGLVGYFGWGNYGDELFFSAFNELFATHDVVIFHDPVQEVLLPDFESLVDSVDAIVIGGGDLLVPSGISWLYWNERFLKKPVFIYGIGVPTWVGSDATALEYYKKFFLHQNVKLICTRDGESAIWVKEYIKPNIEINVYPDIVLASAFPQKLVESRAVGLVLRNQPSYETEMIYRLADLTVQFGLSLKLILLGVGKTLADDYEVINNFKFEKYEISICDTNTLLSREIASCKFVLSMKFHGVIAAYQSGVPFISLSGADKFISFMSQTGNAQYSSYWTDTELPAKFERLIYEGSDFSRRFALTCAAKQGLKKLHHAVTFVQA